MTETVRMIKIILEPCKADFTLECSCGKTTTYGSSMEAKFEEGDVLRCPKCGREYILEVKVNFKIKGD